MRSKYRRLGPYIRELKVRNRDGACSDLRGVSIGKEFMPSVANVHGTDLSKYKLVEQHQFAFNPMHVGRDEVLPIALLAERDPVIVSPAYVVFGVRDRELLLPEYLMMWCRRPEFDRNAWFTTDSSVRGGFSWDNFCDMELPVPSIEKQQEIVKEYQTVVDRIRLNERLNEKLEEAAQAIYKQWFVEFEFPMTPEYAESIGKPELAGQPYKSSGGEMEYNEVLEQEIPKGWKVCRLDDVADIGAGGDKPRDVVQEQTGSCAVPVYSNSTVREGLFGYTSTARVTERSVTVSARGGIGYTALRLVPYVPIVRLIVAIPKQACFLNYLYRSLQRYRYDGAASAQVQLTVPQISQFAILEPAGGVLAQYQELDFSIVEQIKAVDAESTQLSRLGGVLLSRMTRAVNGAERRLG